MTNITDTLMAQVVVNIWDERHGGIGDCDITPVVLSVETWPVGSAEYCPEDIGCVEVTYNTRGNQAVYGFTATGRVTCYMD